MDKIAATTPFELFRTADTEPPTGVAPAARDRRDTPAPIAADDLACTVIDDVGRLAALGCEWNDLQERCGAGTRVFQSHAWLTAWARHFATEAGCCRIAIVTVRRQGRLVAIWPLAVRRTFGIRQVVWAGEPVSQYGDVLVEPGAASDDLLRRSWAYVVATLAPDLVHLRKVRADAAVMPLLAELSLSRSTALAAPCIDFGDAADYATFEQCYSGKARKNRRRLLRRLEEKGKVAFLHLGSGEEAASLVARAIGMKQAWLADRGLLSPALSDPRTATFFREMATTSATAGAILVSALTLDGTPCAIMVAVTAGDRIAGHIFTYDLAFEKAGAGALLLEDCLRYACAAGYRHYDLLAPADAYKLDWTDCATGVADFTIACTTRGRLYDRIVLQLARPGARALAARVNLGWIAALRGGRSASASPADGTAG